MADEPQNPLGMVRDPFAGDSFVLPDLICTDVRRTWLRRTEEILAFLSISELSLKECKEKYEQFVKHKKLKLDTPFKIGFSDGRSTLMSANMFINGCDDGVVFLYRQVFVMLYGAWETYLFEMLEKSFPKVGITEDILKESLDIMMKKGQWDGKFCAIGSRLGVEYRAGELIQHFSGFEMNFEGTPFKNPLHFLDQVAHVRHKIIHASSKLDNGKSIFINAPLLHGLFTFFVLLTDYVDNLLSKAFNFTRSASTKPVAITYYEKSVLNYKRKQYDEAIENMDDAIKIDPTFSSAYYIRGTIWGKEKGNYDQAIENFSEALKFAPLFKQALYNRGVAYFMKGQSNDSLAESDFLKCLELYPDKLEALYFLGLIYQRGGQKGFPKAINYLNKYAHEARPHNNLTEDAIVQINKMLKIDKTLAEYLVNSIDIS